jgi:hypothetical protein
MPLVRFLPWTFIMMLTRREILRQLRDAGVREWSLLKRHCRDFESYMAFRYGLKVAGVKNAQAFSRLGADPSLRKGDQGSWLSPGITPEGCGTSAASRTCS